MKKIEVLGLQTIPEIQYGDRLAQIICDCAKSENIGINEKDIIILTSKIVSKAIGRTRKFSEVKPGKKAIVISKKTGKDARWLQMIFDEGHEILVILPIKDLIEQQIMNSSQDYKCGKELCEHEQAICITKGKDGRIHTCDAGIDGSNHRADVMSLLPKNPDEEAKKIREQIQKICNKQVAVIIADTEIISFGTMDLAVGSAGIEPRAKNFGKVDNFGKPKFGGMDLIAHELTAASALVFGQVNEGIPVVIIRGYEYKVSDIENISNTFLPQNSGDAGKTIKAIMRATSYAIDGLGKKLLLRIGSWFV